jgi:uncharacterized membrane protein
MKGAVDMGKQKIQKKQDVLATKKAAVIGSEKKSRLPLVIGALSAVVLIGAGIFLVNLKMGNTTSVAASSNPEVSGTEVSLPVALFEDGKARHYEHKDGNLTIRYFVLKSSDGIIRAAYDACDVCWPAGKGYYQDGDFMVCRNCGRRFASVKVNEVQGGCNPAPLNRRIDNGKVIILVKDILQGKQYFNLPS